MQRWQASNSSNEVARRKERIGAGHGRQTLPDGRTKVRKETRPVVEAVRAGEVEVVDAAGRARDLLRPRIGSRSGDALASAS